MVTTLFAGARAKRCSEFLRTLSDETKCYSRFVTVLLGRALDSVVSCSALCFLAARTVRAFFFFLFAVVIVKAMS